MAPHLSVSPIELCFGLVQLTPNMEDRLRQIARQVKLPDIRELALVAFYVLGVHADGVVNGTSYHIEGGGGLRSYYPNGGQRSSQWQPIFDFQQVSPTTRRHLYHWIGPTDGVTVARLELIQAAGIANASDTRLVAERAFGLFDHCLHIYNEHNRVVLPRPTPPWEQSPETEGQAAA